MDVFNLIENVNSKYLLIFNDISSVQFSCSVVSDSLRPHELQHARLLCLWNSPGQNTGVGNHSLLQENFPTQGLNPGLPHCRQMLYPSEPQSTSRVTGWIKWDNIWSNRPNTLYKVSTLGGSYRILSPSSLSSKLECQEEYEEQSYVTQTEEPLIILWTIFAVLL